MKKASNVRLKEHILTHENIVDPKDCDFIVKSLNKINLWKPTTVTNGTEEFEDTDYRDCKATNVSKLIDDPSCGSLMKEIDDILFKSVSIILADYNVHFGCGLSKDTGYEVLRYDIGNKFRIHTDDSMNFPRTISLSISLNDDYEGGEWAFWGGEHGLRPKKGTIVTFPSNYLFPHEIKPITKGSRYSMITWLR